VDGAIEGLVLLALERVEEVLAREHTAGGARQQREQLELEVGEHLPLPGDGDLARGEVDLEIAGVEARPLAGDAGDGGGGAAEHGADARKQLARVERL